MKNQTLLLIAAAIIALGAGIMVKRFNSLPQATGQARDLLPAFTLPDVAGKQRSSSEWRSRVLVINFWATWCPPCREEIPEFIALQERYGDKGLQFIGIAIEDQQPVAEYLQQIDDNYPMLIAGDDGVGLSILMGNLMQAVPFTVVVSRQGEIMHRQPGEFSREDLLAVVEPLL